MLAVEERDAEHEARRAEWAAMVKAGAEVNEVTRRWVEENPDGGYRKIFMDAGKAEGPRVG